MSETNTLIIDAVGEIAESANYYVVIRDNTLFLVNRDQDAASAVASYRVPQLLTLSISLPHPIRRLRSTWQQNIPYPNVLRLETQTQQAIIDVNLYGQDLDVEPLSQVESEVETFLTAYYTIAKRPLVQATVYGIVRHEIGDTVEVYDYQQEIRATITVSNLEYNFEDLSTTISGQSLVYHQQDI
jgi:hypothetical protein